MAVSEMLSLKTPIASRLIRCLYIVGLVLIAVMVVLGVMRGIRIMSFTPRPMPAIAGAPSEPGVTTPPGAMAPRPGNRMMMRRFGRGPRAPFGIGRNPVMAGAFTIFFALLRGAIALMVVRILAEIGLAILAMPRRAEIS